MDRRRRQQGLHHHPGGRRQQVWRAHVHCRDPAAGTKPTYKFIAQAGGSENTRTKAGVSVPAGTATAASARASEFSGVADLSGILKEGTALGGEARRAAEATVPIESKYIAVGLQHHAANSGVISKFNLDRGGQVYIYKPDNIINAEAVTCPTTTTTTAVSPAAKIETVFAVIVAVVFVFLA